MPEAAAAVAAAAAAAAAASASSREASSPTSRPGTSPTLSNRSSEDAGSSSTAPEVSSSSPPSSNGRVSRDRAHSLVTPNGQGGNDYVCPLCPETMSSQREFTAHIRGHNEVKPQPDPNDPTGQAKVYYCCLCSKMLSSFSSLDRHMLVHSGERPFSCTLCGQTFTTNGNMHRHKRTHGTRDSHESDASSGGSSNGPKRDGRGRKRKVSVENSTVSASSVVPTSLLDVKRPATSSATTINRPDVDTNTIPPCA